MAPTTRGVALALGPALGAAGLAAALATLLRDKAVAEPMQAHGADLLGGMVTFFVHACRSAEANRALWALFAPLLLVVNALFGIEAGRGGARGPLRWYSLWALLVQVAGVGFVTPALWLPAYATSCAAAERAGAARGVSARRVHTTAGITAVLALGCAAVMLWDVDTRSWRVAATAFQFIAALGLAYPLFDFSATPPADASEAARGAAAASRLYTMLAGAGAALHWASAAALLRGGCGGGVAALQRLRDDVAGNGALRFLLLDFGGLALAATLFAAVEQAPRRGGAARFLASALRGAGWAVLLSPAAPLALWLAEREGRLAAEAAAAVPAGRPRRSTRGQTPKPPDA